VSTGEPQEMENEESQNAVDELVKSVAEQLDASNVMIHGIQSISHY